MSQRPRVLLIEDDPSIRRFVGMALDGLPVELETASDLAEARSQLRDGPFALVICDLMLPDGSGMDLMGELVEHRPELRGQAELAIFSAGVNEAARSRLASWGIQRILSKPISLTELERHVMECTRPRPRSAAEPGHASRQASAESRRLAIDTYFGGDAALFDAFSVTCFAQFGLDVEQADAALAAADYAKLRRVVHSLKTVLLTLGHPDLSALAAKAEAAAAEQLADASLLWVQLRSGLLGLIVNRTG